MGIGPVCQEKMGLKAGRLKRTNQLSIFMNEKLDSFFIGVKYERENFPIKVPGFKCDGVCQLTIVKKADRALVVVTELTANTGKSVTNAVEHLIPAIIKEKNLNPEKTIFIEHYSADLYGSLRPEDSFDRIISYKVNPKWEHISHENFQKLITELWN